MSQLTEDYYKEKMYELELQLDELEHYRFLYSSALGTCKILKRALLIACNGDNVKVIECIDRTITEPENK